VLNEDALRRSLTAAGLDAPVRWDDVTTSTNATALAMARDGAPAWTLVAAGHQTEGRGRGGRTWVDRPGRAVLLSVVLRPDLEAERLGVVSLAAGAAMADAASGLAALEVRCKWPNDLLVEDTKVGGILAESDLEGGVVQHVVVGIGLNVDPPDEVAGVAGIGDVDEEALLRAFLRMLASSLAEGPDAILEAWRSRSDTLGGRVEATTVDGTVVRGVAADVDDRGGLLVDTESGPVTVTFGEIHHLDPRA
jgi:BirA family biotin operon repressor/biotin-[acetyl-CoA-carboxylase] ligase